MALPNGTSFAGQSFQPTKRILNPDWTENTKNVRI